MDAQCDREREGREGNGGGGLPTRLPHGTVDRGLSGTRVARGEDAATEAAAVARFKLAIR